LTLTPASLAFLTFTALYLAIRTVFIRRARSQQKVDKADWRDRLLIVLVGVGQIALPLLFVFTPWLAAADHGVAPVCGVLGAAAMTAGLWLFWRSHVDLGDSWSVSLELNADHRLVTRGVYRVVRHPMYTSFLVSAAGQALLLGNWVAGPAALFAVLLLIVVRLPHEEAMMIEHFGDEYRAYMARTGGVVLSIR
jgi:protein-S-isoprenylcysteine O-methyltransferase Ste14